MKKFWFLILLMATMVAFGQHLLISEIYMQPSVNDTAEFVEIYNPGSNAVNLDQFYLADYPTYYEMVNGTYTSISSDFCIQFPAGAVIQSNQAIVIAVTATSFEAEFGKLPDFEIFNTRPDVPDMNLLSTATLPAPLLGNIREMVMLFSWDGQSDLVKDVDYVTWGTASSTSKVDKSGISIDGPDADTNSSTYANDTDINSQIYLTVTAGRSWARGDTIEVDEIKTGGNGILGHDETSENLLSSFAELNNPTPGSFGLGSAFSGSGMASIYPTVVEQNNSVNLSITIKGEYLDPLNRVGIMIPTGWNWSGSVSDIELSGAGFSSANAVIQNDTVIIENAFVTLNDSGSVTIKNMSPPQTLGEDTFKVFTAIDAEALKPIVTSPVVQVVPGPTPIAEIQQNESQYLGQIVKIRGYVVLGAGKTTTSWTDAYIADETGVGINIYQGGTVDPSLVRGNLVEIEGEVASYQGVTEITNYTVTVLLENQKLPEPIQLTTGDANNLQMEGYWIQVEGVITDYAAGVGGGTNITVDDGSGGVTVRVWDATGVNTSFFAVGDTVVVNGPLDVYQGKTQILVGYQEDIRFKNQNFSLADGSGLVSANITSVPKDSNGISLEITIQGNVPDTISTVDIILPVYWAWDSLNAQIQLQGIPLQNASLSILDSPYEPTPTLHIENVHIGLGEEGKVIIPGLTSPSKDILSTVFIKTAGKEGTLTFTSNQPQIVVGSGQIVPIRDIQLNSALFSGSPVTIRGEVTIGGGVIRTDRTSAYIQDSSWYGININKQSLDTTNLKRHYFVEITGTVSEYQEVTQISPTSITVLDSNSNFVAPFEVPSGDANSARWDGTLVKTYGVVIDFYSTNTSAGDYNIRITDGSKPIMIRIWGTTGIDITGIEQGKTAIWATGVGSVFREEYQLLVGYQDQIEIDENYRPSLDRVALEIPPHPFVPGQGEKLTIKVNAGAPATHIILRIFDLSGREVITLMDATVEEVFITKQWNGRDTYNNLVPLGTYICQLEILDPITGKRRFKRAPIVVGTILK